MNVYVALAVAIAFLLGLVNGLWVRRPRSVPPALPICACTHPLGAHVDGRCGAAVNREHYMRNGTRNGREWVSCACRRYVGPEHIADIWVPPVVTGDPR